MDYKIFGPGRSPHDDFVPQLKAFLELDEVQRDALTSWFESTSDFETYAPELPPKISASTLLPDQFRQTVAPIRFILSAWQQFGLQIADIERDLLLLGFDPKQIKVLTGVLERLSDVKKRVWVDELTVGAQFAGLATVDDANIVWDARAVFGGPNYYVFNADAQEDTYNECFGLTSMAIFEFMVSDTSGTKQRLAFQMNDSTFRQFLRAMNRADGQRQTLNALIEPLTVGSEKSKRVKK